MIERHRCWMATVIASAALLGCGESKKAAAPQTEAAEPETEAIKQRTADSLPAIGDYLPLLDDGRVEVAPPKGWNVLGRKPNYLANFTKGKASELPRISITVGDSPASFDEVTEENAAAFAAEMAKKLKAEKKSSIVEPPKPIMLGQTVWSRHVRNPLNAGSPIAIQTLQTARGGRLYAIDLVVDVSSQQEYAAGLQQERDQGYAVAANMKFPK